jgi:hypothetical protein
MEDYQMKIPKVDWDGSSTLHFYRAVFRKMIGATSERTLSGTIMIRDSGHIDGCFSVAFDLISDLVIFSALASSIPYDFFIKTTGKSNFRNELLVLFPLTNVFAFELSIRNLALVCLTNHYSELWKKCWDDGFREESWAKKDPRLPKSWLYVQIIPVDKL